MRGECAEWARAGVRASVRADGRCVCTHVCHDCKERDWREIHPNFNSGFSPWVLGAQRMLLCPLPFCVFIKMSTKSYLLAL